MRDELLKSKKNYKYINSEIKHYFIASYIDTELILNSALHAYLMCINRTYKIAKYDYNIITNDTIQANYLLSIMRLIIAIIKKEYANNIISNTYRNII